MSNEKTPDNPDMIIPTLSQHLDATIPKSPPSTLFQKGGQGGPGRKKGSKRKKESVQETLRRMNCNLTEELVNVVMGNHVALKCDAEELTMKLRVDTMGLLMPYTQEKVKTRVDHNVNGGGKGGGGLSIQILMPSNEDPIQEPIDVTPIPKAIEQEPTETYKFPDNSSDVEEAVTVGAEDFLSSMVLSRPKG